ncbi:MAG: hypothetical protein EXR75_07090 [Myxococcales bacterium]|nr:hypothetical protein [Myxococcales bacterium]
MSLESTPPVAENDASPPWKDVAVEWEALEDAFENNAPEVHSYLHVATGDVLRIVDGVADPHMHARIAADPAYLRIEPVSSREQYRWMERFIPLVEEPPLQEKLTRAIDGKGAFRRFKDVLMTHATIRERWFAFRSERLRIFMEAWLNAHALTPTRRIPWSAEPDLESAPGTEDVATLPEAVESFAPRARTAESLRRKLRELVESLGIRDLELFATFGEFLRIRQASYEARAALMSASGSPSRPGNDDDFATGPAPSAPSIESATAEAAAREETPPSSNRIGRRKAASS